MADNHYCFHIEPLPFYDEEQSDVANDRYVFGYQIRITNAGKNLAKLISRHWVITDAHGHIQEVKGLGVVGEQPCIAPGETYQYSSGVVFDTPYGTMKGIYHMVSDNGVAFDVEVPEMTFVAKRILH